VGIREPSDLLTGVESKADDRDFAAASTTAEGVPKSPPGRNDKVIPEPIKPPTPRISRLEEKLPFAGHLNFIDRN
jgi:hypothetical protein